MVEVKFGVKFLDWKKGEKANLSKRFADKYIAMGACSAVKPKVKRKAAPSNKMVQGAANK
jgi:hypothetical protein